MDINGTNFYLILTRNEWLGNIHEGSSPSSNNKDKLSWDSSVQAVRLKPRTKMPRPYFYEEGKLVLPVFDGKEPGCVWHRLFLDAYIPPGTSVKIESYATDQINDIPGKKAWQTEPSLYCRADGAELPYYKPFTEEDVLPDSKGTWELLFQRAHGRYLYLRLTLTGPGNMTPYLYALRVYYPRFSYLEEYLPAVYKDIKQYSPEDINEAGGETKFSPFLERFLANIEGFYTVWEGRIAQAQALFDVDITALEYLEWLAGWFGVILDPSWHEARRRLFIRHALELFNQRGTPLGLIRAIRLAIDLCPDDDLFKENVAPCCNRFAQGGSVRIVESFLTRCNHRIVFGDPTEDEQWDQFVPRELTTKEKAHRFIVLVPMDPGMDMETQQQRLEQVKRIVQIEKPAHTFCVVKAYWALHSIG